MVCGLETREAIFDKAQQWVKSSHSASRNGIASFLKRLHVGLSHADSEVLWGMYGQPVSIALSSSLVLHRSVADSFNYGERKRGTQMIVPWSFGEFQMHLFIFCRVVVSEHGDIEIGSRRVLSLSCGPRGSKQTVAL